MENPAYCKACNSVCEIVERLIAEKTFDSPAEYDEPRCANCGAHYEEAIDLTETENAIEAVEHLINKLKEARRAA